MRLQTIATLGVVALLCCASTVVIAGDIAEDATHAPWLPDPDLTPGAINPAVTQANIGETICNHGIWSTKAIRPSAHYPSTLKRRQLEKYGYADKNPRQYEEDDLIPLEIGGNQTDLKNLWPEPLNGKWGAHAKDKLEGRLKQLVCSGSLSLQDAQTAIANNWITAYKRYVVDEPKVAMAP